MIANPKWFSVRKYGGWGVVPRTWQGWLYIAIMILPFMFVKQNSPIFFAWLIFLLVDIGDVMIRMKKDEREMAHEAIADRNACWVMIAIILVYFLYEIFTKMTVNPIFLVILIAGAVAKTITNWYLNNK